MGDPPNLFHNRRIESPLEVSITFQDRALQDQLKKRYIAEFQRFFTTLLRFVEYTSRAGNRPREAEIATRIRRLIETDRPSLKVLSRALKELEASEEVFALLPDDFPGIPSFLTGSGGRLDGSRGQKFSKQDFELVINLLSALRELDVSYFAAKFKLLYSERDQVMIVREVSLLSGEQLVCLFELRDTEAYLKTHLLSDGDLYPDELTSFPINANDRTVFRCMVDESPSDKRPDLVEIFRSLLNTALQNLEALFYDVNLRHIGPLRAYPRRFYFLDVANVLRSKVTT
jgi:hypothetical protein